MSQGPESQTSFEDARRALLTTLRSDIADERVLEAMGQVPREIFVPEDLHDLAYYDRALRIGHGQTISQPRMVAIMLQELALKGEEKVLDVGTGSGYQAAVLSHLARLVVGVELIPELAERARRDLRRAGIENVEVHLAGDELGWPQGGPYDAIVVAAASPRVPQSLVAQLAPGGRLVIPVGEPGDQYLLRVENRPEGLVVTRRGSVAFVPLVGNEAFPEAQ